MSHLKVYLGDAVYADVEEQEPYLVLTTEDGVQTTNRILLERPVLQHLIDYLKRLDWLRDGTDGA